MADYLVTTDFKAKDFVSPTLRAMETRTDQFAKHTRTTFREVFSGSFLGALGANFLSRGIYQVQAGISNLVEEYKDFDTQINAAAVKFGGIDYGSKEFAQLGAVAREVGRTTKFTAGDAASGLMEMAGAGFEAQNAMKLLEPMANFAAAAKMNLADATGVAGAALNAFSMNSENAAVQAKNLTVIADKMAEADRMSMASMQGLSETVAWGATDFTNAGQSMESFLAIAAALADVKKEGSVGGTVLRGMARDFANLSDKGRKALVRLAGPINFKGPVDFIEILKKMEPKLKGLSGLERTRALGKIFDTRAASGISALFGQGIDKVERFRMRLEKTSGGAKRMGDQLNQSLTYRIMALHNALQEKGFQVFERFLTDGRGGIESMIEAINKWDVTPLADGLNKIAKALTFAASHVDDLIRLGKAFLIIKGATKAMDAVRWIRDLRGMLGGLQAAHPFFMSMSEAMKYSSAAAMTAPVAGGMVPGMVSQTAMAQRYGGGIPTGPTTIKAPKATLEGALNATFSVAAAGLIGWQIGTAIRENFIEPAIDEIFKQREKLDTNVINVKHQIVTGKISVAEAEKKIEQQKKDVWGTFTSFKGGMDVALGAVTSLFTGKNTPIDEFKRQYKDIKSEEQALSVRKIKESEQQMYTPNFPAETWDVPVNQGLEDYKANLQREMDKIETARNKEISKFNVIWGGSKEFGSTVSDTTLKAFEDRIENLNRSYDVYLQQLEKLNETTREAAANAGVTHVKIEVAGEGAKRVTTTTKSSGPRAPNVDVKRAGAN